MGPSREALEAAFDRVLRDPFVKSADVVTKDDGVELEIDYGDVSHTDSFPVEVDPPPDVGNLSM